MKASVKTSLTGLRRVLNPDGVHARVGDCGVVLYEQTAGRCPSTPAQIESRERLGRCAAVWRGLPAAEKAAWSRAARGMHTWRAETQGYLTGYSLFLHAGLNRMQLGLEPCTFAPVDAPPEAPSMALLLPSDDPRRFAFLVGHMLDAGDCAQHRVRALLTPATSGPGRVPEARFRRLICGFGPDSNRPLVMPRQPLVFPPAQIAVPPGSRFGVWLRIVRVRDGLASEELFCDLTRTGTLRRLPAAYNPRWEP